MCVTGLSAIGAMGYRLWLPADLTEREQPQEKRARVTTPTSLQPGALRPALLVPVMGPLYKVRFLQS